MTWNVILITATSAKKNMPAVVLYFYKYNVFILFLYLTSLIIT